MTDNTDGFDTGIGIEEETGPESGMPSEGPDMTRDRPALFDGDTGDMPLEARMAAIALKRARLRHANATATPACTTGRASTVRPWNGR